jgi:hypothetical protein
MMFRIVFWDVLPCKIIVDRRLEVRTASIIGEHHKRQTSIPREGFETAIPVTKRPQTYALDRAASGIGETRIY